MELAQAYFPAILPRSAWKKLKVLLMDDPQTASLASLSRRTFLPAEVSIIFSVLGVPWQKIYTIICIHNPSGSPPEGFLYSAQTTLHLRQDQTPRAPSTMKNTNAKTCLGLK